jgi:hypothetical protein
MGKGPLPRWRRADERRRSRGAFFVRVRVMRTPVARTSPRTRSSSDGSGGGAAGCHHDQAQRTEKRRKKKKRKKEKKGSRTPVGADFQPPQLPLRRCPHPDPPRRAGREWEGAARLPAFHCGSCRGDSRRPRLSVRPCFLGRGRSVRSLKAAPTGERRSCASPRALPAPEQQKPVPVQRSTSRAGHCAGRMMPKPPGSEGDEPPRAGTAHAPPNRGRRLASLRERGGADTAIAGRCNIFPATACNRRRIACGRSRHEGARPDDSFPAS